MCPMLDHHHRFVVWPLRLRSRVLGVWKTSSTFPRTACQQMKSISSSKGQRSSSWLCTRASPCAGTTFAGVQRHSSSQRSTISRQWSDFMCMTCAWLFNLWVWKCVHVCNIQVASTRHPRDLQCSLCDSNRGLSMNKIDPLMYAYTSQLHSARMRNTK